MRPSVIAHRFGLLLALGLLIWGAVGAIREQRELQALDKPVDKAWVMEWLCIRRDECGEPSQATLDSSRQTIETERASRRLEHQAPRRRYLLIAILGPAIALLGTYLLRRQLPRRPS